jgi:hypothetical protein
VREKSIFYLPFNANLSWLDCPWARADRDLRRIVRRPRGVGDPLPLAVRHGRAVLGELHVRLPAAPRRDHELDVIVEQPQHREVQGLPIDSDTLLEPDALVRVVEPLKLENVGASTGNVLLLNERQNLLTRMIGTYYWIGLNIYKQAQSVIRSVVCCSGCLAAYRADLLREVILVLRGMSVLAQRLGALHGEEPQLGDAPGGRAGLSYPVPHGGVPERSNGAVLKTAASFAGRRGFKSHPRR